jgi:hypothetical protein
MTDDSPRTIHLNIGELVVSREPVVISTVLGSCVSVCLYSKTGVGGGMTHHALASVRVTDEPPVNRHKPSVDHLFYSMASLLGDRALGVILTGMGADGAHGLLEMRRKGSLTLGQDAKLHRLRDAQDRIRNRRGRQSREPCGDAIGHPSPEDFRNRSPSINKKRTSLPSAPSEPSILDGR